MTAFGQSQGRLGVALAALLVTASLAGCASYAKEDPAIADAAALPVTCFNSKDCTEKWSRARVWLAAHTRRPITGTATALRTAMPTAADPSPGFEVTFTLRSASQAIIGFNATCRGSCRPDEQQMLGDFNLYLSATDQGRSHPSAPAKP